MIPLFAQARGNQPNPPDLAAMAVFFGPIFLIVAVVYVCYLVAVATCLRRVSEENRRMSPGQVWLCLIPVFGFVWEFIMIGHLSDSLIAEYRDRGLRRDGDFGWRLGIRYKILTFLCVLPGAIFFIAYWAKIVGYSRELLAEILDERDRGHQDHGWR